MPSPMARPLLASVCLLALATAAAAQPVAAPARVTFEEAIRLALERNPGVAQAAQAILRAEAVLQQTQSLTRPVVNASVTTTALDAARGFDEFVTQPQVQSLIGVGVAYPVLAASRWAARAQAQDQVRVAGFGLADSRRQVALATAQAYLAIIAQQRQVEVNERARENALAHLEYARARLQAGAGSKLNELRAAQELATGEVLLEAARLGVRRAQEALGVLIVEDGPVDAAGEPAFEVPRTVHDNWWFDRPDVQLVASEVSAAGRVVEDSWKDWVPTASASFEPQLVTPRGLFQPSRTWRGVLSVAVPLHDAGTRRAITRQRQVVLDVARLQLSDVEIRARADRRLADAAVESTERALTHARESAAHASEVLRITDLAFRAGATTNLELVDAQRRARDADTAAAQAEDRVRQARLDLLVALGRFP